MKTRQGTTGGLKMAWTPEVVQAAKLAAVAMASFWDELRRCEIVNGVEVDGTVDMIGTMAADYDHPPNVNDLSDQSVTDYLDELPIDWVEARKRKRG